MTSSDTCEWFEGRFSVICRYEGSGPMGPSKGLGILGYSTEEKVYTYYAVDNTNMGMASVPKGTVQGDTWTYTDEATFGGEQGQIPSHDQGAIAHLPYIQAGDPRPGWKVDAHG